jgi:hypothetical protein
MTRRQVSKTVESLTSAFVERLLDAVERAIDARARTLTTEWVDLAMATHPDSEQLGDRRARGTARAHTLPDGTDGQSLSETVASGATADAAVPPLVRSTRLGRRAKASTAAGKPPAATAAPPSPDPEQERRDAELARLRALLKPTGQDDASRAADALPARPAANVVAPPSDPLRLVEDEVRAQAHGLAQLSATSCTARIAAWAGRVRSYEETSGNRVAAQLLLDKLRALARAMDAGRIEALNGSWRTADWPSYIQTNQALAEAPQARSEAPVPSIPEPSGEPDYQDVWSQPS